MLDGREEKEEKEGNGKVRVRRRAVGEKLRGKEEGLVVMFLMKRRGEEGGEKKGKDHLGRESGKWHSMETRKQ